ncbi:MAG TPA: hypothetical protein VKK31_03745 [Thermoanaerobaculia bacterium]|nr:hypothetical protein [Thermoanaerobaculia bacterium]
MAKNKKLLLEALRQKKNSCSLSEAEAALAAWDFQAGRQKGNTRVWNYKHVTLTLHVPHGKSGGRNLDPGAVAIVIRKIEEADAIQQSEANNVR